MFGVGPAWLILWCLRVPRGSPWHRWRDWLSIVGTDAALAALVTVLVLLLGPLPVLLGWLPVMLLAATIGVWLFYVQHQFENTRWAHEAQWSLPEAALHGSSYYDLPPVYRLREVLRDYPELGTISRVTLWQSLRCVNYTLWDEDAQRLISFAALRRKLRGSGAAA